MTRQNFNRLTVAIAAAMFVAAVAVLYRELGNTRWIDIVGHFEALSRTQILAALALTAASYLVLTAYDFLALHYVRRRLRVRDTLFASFVAYAFSNSIGFALVSGGSLRYRIYSGLGVRPVAIGEIVVFCTVTYSLGVTIVSGLLLLADPAGIASILGLPQPFLLAAGAAMLGIGITYLAVILARRGPITLGRYGLRLPSLGCALMQIAVACCDQAVAASVVYALFPSDAQIGFAAFLEIYVVSAPIALLSLVPGGLGVFETMVVSLLANTSSAAALGSLIAYRVIYFVVPLALAILLVAIYEIRRSSRDRPAQAAGIPTRNVADDR